MSSYVAAYKDTSTKKNDPDNKFINFCTHSSLFLHITCRGVNLRGVVCRARVHAAVVRRYFSYSLLSG
jgi:hypothetical protein